MSPLAPMAMVVVVLGVTTLLMLGSDDTTSERLGASSPANLHPPAGTFIPDDTELSQCQDARCLEQAFGNLVYEEGPERGFQVFDRESAREGPVQADCHRIAHYMGAAALTRFEGNVGEAFSRGSSSCSSGYYHGILERAFADVSVEDRGQVARQLCTGVRDQGNFLTFQCIHGLGHGLMITTGYELPAALATCGELETDWDRDSCRGGIFMENIATATGSPIEVSGDPRWLRDDDLLYPCTDDELVPAPSKEQCYGLATSRVLQANGYDFADGARWCRRAERRWVGACFQSLGRDSSGSTTYDPEPTVRQCRDAGSYFDLCLWGAARDYVTRYAGTPKAAGVCTAAPAKLREHCFTGIGAALAATLDDPRRRLDACRAMTARHPSACRRGVRHPAWASDPPRRPSAA